MSDVTSPREGQTLAGESLLVRYANFVRLPHTLLALPVVPSTSARFVALGFNRIADRELDRRNPRTRNRELPSGRLSLAQAWSAVVVASLVFLACAWALNPLCFALAPVALIFISAYS